MQLACVPAAELTADDLSRWSQMQRADAHLHSPFFRPEYVQLVAQFCRGVEVAVIDDGGEPIGYFPFARTTLNVGTPVGGSLCDFHGVVLEMRRRLDVQWLIRSCHLAAWRFDNLVAAQRVFYDHCWTRWPAYYLNLADGFDGYRDALRQRGKHVLRRVRQKRNKLIREAGPLRLEADIKNLAILRQVIDWKQRQYHCSGARNYLSASWRQKLLERLLFTDNDALRGMLTVLYAGDQMAAAHFGLRSFDVLHGWFPVYDVELAQYSPGQLMWVELAQAAESLGIRRIDLGKGQERYKRELMTGATCTAEGAVDLRPVRGALQHGWYRARMRVHNSPLQPLASFVARSTRTCLGLTR